MFTATMICNPAEPRLDAATVDAVRQAWGGGDTRWLNYGVAAEFDIESVTGNRWEVGEGVQGLGADMDSTMIQQECID